MKLYDVATEIQDILDQLDDMDDEDEQKRILKSLELVEDSFEAKVDNIVGYAKNLKADVKIIGEQVKILEEEKQRLRAVQESLLKRTDSMLQWTWNQIAQTGRERFKSLMHTVWTQKSPQKVDIIDANLLPDEFVILERKPNKSAIKEHFNSTGELLPGTNVTQSEGVRIK